MQTPHVSTGDTGTAAWADAVRDDAYGGSVLRARQQDTPGMTLYVENGAYYINGVRYLFAGGSTPTFTAPVTHPRIDLVTIDTTGTLTITEGTEAASPSVPSYPENVITLCEVYHVVGETAIYTSNSANYGWTSTQGYIQNDVRPIVVYGPNFGAIGEDLIPDAANTRSLGSSGTQWKNIYGENVYMNGALMAATKFGGTGADGSIAISSGTVTIDLGGAAYYEKNYSSISITGTGALAFSNPSANGTVIVLKCSGNCTITSSATRAIDLRSIGASAGSYGVGLLCGPRAPFTTSGYYVGTGGAWASGSNGGSGVHIAARSAPSGLNAFAGAGGASGNSGGGNVAGTGGAGGGGLYIQCAGSLNFTATIDTSGSAGGNGSGSSAGSFLGLGGGGGGSNSDGGNGSNINTGSGGAVGAGGGGGGAGSVIILATSITANTGIVTTTGGSGGTGTGAGGSGGAGFSYVGLNTYFA